MAAAVWGLFLAVVTLSYTTTVQSASIGADNHVGVKPSLPAYDDGFMRKLCTFLGASYVRSAKDPQCWYTWCHAGEPYHMQCPPGRSVSPHFYWSSEDPCTEADGQEKCLVGFLKNMHLDIKDEEVKADKDDETPHLNDKQTPVEGKQAPVYKEVDPVEEPLEVTPIEYKEEPQEEFFSEVSVGGKNDEEPIPEPEPTPEVRRKEPKMVLKRVEQEQRKDGVYYPAYRRSHVVDSFIPQDSPYGHVPNYNTYYQHYSPPSYFQKLPSTGIQQPQADYLRSADEAPMVYRKPEAKQAPLPQSDPNEVNEEGMPQEPMYDAEYIGADYPQSASNEEEEGYDNEDQPEYEYVDSQQLAEAERPSSESVTELPQVTMQKEEDEKEENTEEQGDEDIVEAGDDGGEKDPMLYDYFKTHFVEEI